MAQQLILWFGLCLVLLPVSPAHAGEKDAISVLFDRADPQKSIGVMGEEILEVGDVHEKYKVRSFDIDAIILEDQESREAVKILSRGTLNEKRMRRARHFFAVKQLRAIHEAQLRYLRELEQGYAPDLQTLIHHEFLSDGFLDSQKQNYLFKVIETTQEFGREPNFWALAAPNAEIQPDLYFSVDALGLVRYADTATQAKWGPAWDYMDHSGGPRVRSIGIRKE